MPDDAKARRKIAVASAVILLALSLLIGAEVLVPKSGPESPEVQIAEVLGLAVVIGSLGTIVVTWMKHKP